METATKFKPILMFRNEESIKHLEEHINDSASKLNEAVIKIESFLKVKLNGKEKVKALTEGIEYVKNHLKKSFQFPNATDEFNMQALGLDISEIKPVLDSAKSLVNSPYMKIINGSFQLSDKGKKIIIDQCSIHTANMHQSDCYNLALELCETLNKAKDKKYFSDIEMNQLDHTLSFIHQGVYLENFIPNHLTISRLNERGQFMR